MEELKNSVMAICIVLAAESLIGNLVSGTRLRSQMKLLLDVVLAVCIISPFAGGMSRFELPDARSLPQPESEYTIELYNESLRRTVSGNVSSVLMEQITAKGIVCEKIETEVNISMDGSISISRVEISSDDFAAAAEVVRESLGAQTVVTGAEEQ